MLQNNIKLDSIVKRDNTIQRMTAISPKTWKVNNFLNNSPNQVSDESVNIYTKNECQ